MTLWTELAALTAITFMVSNFLVVFVLNHPMNGT